MKIMVGNYKVITLCGSTKFKDKFMEVQKDLTLKGNIVISVGCFGHSGDVFTDDQKTMLDDMHKRKIDMADEIFVINVDNYIGSSTRSEILYALSMNKKVNFLEGQESMAAYAKVFSPFIEQMNCEFIDKVEMKAHDMNSEDKNSRTFPSSITLDGHGMYISEKEDAAPFSNGIAPPYNEDMYTLSKKEDDTYHHNEETLSFNFVNEFIDNL